MLKYDLKDSGRQHATLSLKNNLKSKLKAKRPALQWIVSYVIANFKLDWVDFTYRKLRTFKVQFLKLV
jgi:hypothetical protein